MSAVQIVKREPGESRWQFVAHGAGYDKTEAEQMKARYESRGCDVRFLPVRRKKL